MPDEVFPDRVWPVIATYAELSLLSRLADSPPAEPLALAMALPQISDQSEFAAAVIAGLVVRGLVQLGAEAIDVDPRLALCIDVIGHAQTGIAGVFTTADAVHAIRWIEDGRTLLSMMPATNGAVAMTVYDTPNSIADHATTAAREYLASDEAARVMFQREVPTSQVGHSLVIARDGTEFAVALSSEPETDTFIRKNLDEALADIGELLRPEGDAR